ncbi:hypothetical protein OE88DRAFT_1654250 [Heliocybe sulcata]|uniref:Uncharacterized protein n=1 Tax=Heliocybe sulcata TaxID=5364 RepID=A0A5C3NBR8_9AGAM|nr:hypothetical protein OE88DRAFT_1654250 [Heliocybe sulcata]
MTAPANGIISASKRMLRYWRDVRNRQHLVYVAGSQSMLWPIYLSSTCNSFVQKRWASAAKTIIYQDKHHSPPSNIADIPATAATRLRKDSAVSLRTLNQTRLDVEDFVDLAGRGSKLVRFALAPEEPGPPIIGIDA